MRTTIAIVSRIFAAFFALIFMLTAALVVFAFVARYELLRPDPYKQALQQVNAYERAPQVLAEAITVSTTPGGEQSAIFLSLTQADYEILVRRLLPREWLRIQVESVIDQGFAGLRQEGGLTTITISLSELKQRLNSEAGSEALLEIVQTRPSCPEGNLAAFTCGFNLDGTVSCRPPQLQTQLCGSIINTALAAVSSALPEEITLSGLLQTSVAVTAPIRTFMEPYIYWLQLLTSIGWLIPLLLLFLVTVFGARSLRSLLQWWGLPFMGLASLLMLMALFNWFVPTWFVQGLVADLATVAPLFAQLLVDVAAVLGRQLAFYLGAVALVAGIIGLLSTLLSFLVPAPRRQAAR